MKTSLQIATAGVSLALLPLLAACSGQPADPVAAARQLPDAPSWVSAPSGTDCGEVEFEAQGTLPDVGLDCLRDAARAGQAASLSWVERTTEGDPVPSFARITGSGVTVASTSAYDAYGTGGWSEVRCADVAALPGCADGTG